MHKYIKQTLFVLLLAVLILPAAGIWAEQSDDAVITLIIDDVGNNPDEGLEALNLPGDIVYAFLPNTPYATILAEIAHEKGKQVMLHIPMEAEHHQNLGPDGLKLEMPEQDYKATVYNALQSVPYAVGINNHMGSLLTQYPEPMKWLMDILLENKLFFLDSRTTDKTIAQKTAEIMGVKNLRRDIFLDNLRDEKEILKQFNRLVHLAKHKGYATGIGHPYPETIAVLNQQIPILESQGVKLVFASELLNNKNLQKQNLAKRSSTWSESSSPSHRVAKN